MLSYILMLVGITLVLTPIARWRLRREIALRIPRPRHWQIYVPHATLRQIQTSYGDPFMTTLDFEATGMRRLQGADVIGSHAVPDGQAILIDTDALDHSFVHTSMDKPMEIHFEGNAELFRTILNQEMAMVPGWITRPYSLLITGSIA